MHEHLRPDPNLEKLKKAGLTLIPATQYSGDPEGSSRYLLNDVDRNDPDLFVAPNSGNNKPQ